MAIDLPAGWAVARFGDKAVMLAAVGLMLITALLASQATSPLQLGIAAFAFGSAVAAWLLARLTHISDKVPAIQRGKAISTMAGIQRVGRSGRSCHNRLCRSPVQFRARFLCDRNLRLFNFFDRRL